MIRISAPRLCLCVICVLALAPTLSSCESNRPTAPKREPTRTEELDKRAICETIETWTQSMLDGDMVKAHALYSRRKASLQPLDALQKWYEANAQNVPPLFSDFLVEQVAVEGNKATVLATRGDGVLSTLLFVKEGGIWKLDQ
ncbi:MAG: hypothetical protein RDV41_15270 [Planctomycetota bacterium]|nr:hypothetical protein [Planctomycetota bacterium]